MRERTLTEEFDVPQARKNLQDSIRSLMIHGETPIPLQRVLGLVNNIAHSIDEGVVSDLQIDLLMGLISITVFADPRYQSRVASQYLEVHGDIVMLYETHSVEVQPQQLSWMPNCLRGLCNIVNNSEIYPEMVDQYRIIPHGAYAEDASHIL